MNGPRQVIATIPMDSMLDLITGRRMVNNVPEGAKVISAWFDRFTPTGEPMLLRVRIESAELPETEQGARIPKMRLCAPWTKPKS